MTSIAIMQPYFIPYAGYFRLMHAADIFVIYDCVQFPRRGFVHRNQLYKKHTETKNWLTLPLRKQPQCVSLHQLQFKNGYQDIIKQRLASFGIKQSSLDLELWQKLVNIELSPVDYIQNLLAYFCKKLDITTQFIYSSQLNILATLKGQDRIIAIVKKLAGDCYINAPKGIDLYDEETFEKNHIQLRFLAPYSGEHISILQHFIAENPALTQLIDSIKKQSTPVKPSIRINK